MAMHINSKLSAGAHTVTIITNWDETYPSTTTQAHMQMIYD